MEWMGSFAPSPAIFVWWVLFSIAAFENQRWVRARASGIRGASEATGLVVDAIGAVATIGGLAMLAAHVFDFGWRPTLGLFGLKFLLLGCWGLVGSFMPNIVLWIIGTVSAPILMVVVAAHLSWFGII